MLITQRRVTLLLAGTALISPSNGFVVHPLTTSSTSTSCRPPARSAGTFFGELKVATNGEETATETPSTKIIDEPEDEPELIITTEGPTSMTFFDIDDECEGSSCLLPDDQDPIDSCPIAKEERKTSQNRVDQVLFFVPIFTPLLAYVSYEMVASLSDDVIELLSNKNFVVVDGGAYESKIIAPAINGVVVPSIAILFATLISETITSLRQRQQDIRTTINMEATELRVLQAMVDAFPAGSLVQDRCRAYLIQYTSRLIAESQPGTDIEEACGGDSEMNGFLATLNGVNTEHDILRDSLLAESYGAVSRLNSERSQRISSLQSTFPALHFVILSVLASSICFAFLLETNQDILIFLNAVQLKLLWAMLVGVFSALGTVCYDLVDPFRGSYQISKATVDQLYTIRSALRASAQLSECSIDSEPGDMCGENEF
jgi:hypothetical protein